MKAEAWNRIYTREKATDADLALATLVKGLLRESEAHRDLDRANDIWNEVRKNHPELVRDGFYGYCIATMPESYQLFKRPPSTEEG